MDTIMSVDWINKVVTGKVFDVIHDATLVAKDADSTSVSTYGISSLSSKHHISCHVGLDNHGMVSVGVYSTNPENKESNFEFNLFLDDLTPEKLERYVDHCLSNHAKAPTLSVVAEVFQKAIFGYRENDDNERFIQRLFADCEEPPADSSNIRKYGVIEAYLGGKVACTDVFSAGNAIHFHFMISGYENKRFRFILLKEDATQERIERHAAYLKDECKRWGQWLAGLEIKSRKMIYKEAYTSRF